MNNTRDVEVRDDSGYSDKLTQVRVSKTYAHIIRVQAALSAEIHGEAMTRQRWLEMAIANQKRLEDQLKTRGAEQAPNRMAA